MIADRRFEGGTFDDRGGDFDEPNFQAYQTRVLALAQKYGLAVTQPAGFLVDGPQDYGCGAGGRGKPALEDRVHPVKLQIGIQHARVSSPGLDGQRP